MSPEFYAIIGVGVSTIVLLSGLMIFLFNVLNRRIDELGARVDRLYLRMDRLEDRMDGLENKFDQLLERVHSLDLRVSKLEWMLDAALYGKPIRIPPESDNGDPTSR